VVVIYNCGSYPIILYMLIMFQTSKAISGINEHNKDLVKKYHREMHLRKKYHNELVELKGIVYTCSYFIGEKLYIHCTETFFSYIFCY